MFRVAAISAFLLCGVLLGAVSRVPEYGLEVPAKSAAEVGERSGFVGDSACVGCHRAESLSYAHTEHRATSAVASRESIHGRLEKLTIVDPANAAGEPGLEFVMAAQSGGFSETAVVGSGGDLLKKTEPIDLVTGSGKRGQTFLSWQGDRLFELPVSYWTKGSRWINSPGYVDGTADFARPVHPGCLECHASYVRPLSSDPATNRYERASFQPGISCETCHGPGAAHVASEGRNAAKPETGSADSLILNPAKFSRERQVDLCALCHNGINREALRAAFTYRPGEALVDYFKPLGGAAEEHPDVHGNQVGLLERSKCFVGSTTMTCSTCHNTHEPEKVAASYSVKCLTCHTWQSCGESKRLGHKIVENCIDCHMPVEETRAIVSQTAGETIRASMRTHWIKVYAKR